jgi:hypothetical protein
VENTPELKLVEEPAEPKKLLEVEFERMEKARVLRELRAKEVALVDLKAKFLDAQEMILKLQVKCLEIERRVCADDRDTISGRKRMDAEAAEENMSKIKERLSIKGRFGFDPDTLEVIEDEEPQAKE